jgi:dCMP deaminase
MAGKVCVLIKSHEYKWMLALGTMADLFSTCAKRQYAAVVLAPNKRVAGFGYNGSPSGMAHCVDGACPRMMENSASGSNYDTCISQHAEAGALLWSDPSLRQGGTLIVNGPPCMGCAKLIASSGVKRVVCKEDNSYANWDSVYVFLKSAGVEVLTL